jgi:hypothetical protein
VQGAREGGASGNCTGTRATTMPTAAKDAQRKSSMPGGEWEPDGGRRLDPESTTCPALPDCLRCHLRCIPGGYATEPPANPKRDRAQAPRIHGPRPHGSGTAVYQQFDPLQPHFDCHRARRPAGTLHQLLKPASLLCRSIPSHSLFGLAICIHPIRSTQYCEIAVCTSRVTGPATINHLQRAHGPQTICSTRHLPFLSSTAIAPQSGRLSPTSHLPISLTSHIWTGVHLRISSPAWPAGAEPPSNLRTQSGHYCPYPRIPHD